MTDEQRRSHALSQLRATREIYSETGDSIYLAVIDSHLRTIAEVDDARRLAQERRQALLQSLRAREDTSWLEETLALGRESAADAG